MVMYTSSFATYLNLISLDSGHHPKLMTAPFYTNSIVAANYFFKI
jgi:hypothetical protein